MNLSNITGWAKSHPWTTGAVVIGGGLTFILLSGWFTGGSEGGNLTVNQAGLSEAEVAASAQLESQRLAAQTQNYSTNAQLKIAELQVGMLTKQSELEYLGQVAELGLISKQSELEYMSNVAALETSKTITLQNIASQQFIAQQTLAVQENISERQISADRQTAAERFAYEDTKAARDQYDYQTAIRLENDLKIQQLQSQERLMGSMLDRIPVAQVG